MDPKEQGNRFWSILELTKRASLTYSPTYYFVKDLEKKGFLYKETKTNEYRVAKAPDLIKLISFARPFNSLKAEYYHSPLSFSNTIKLIGSSKLPYALTLFAGSELYREYVKTEQVHAYVLKDDKKEWEKYLLSKNCLKAERKDSNLTLLYVEPLILALSSKVKGFCVASASILLSDLISFGGLAGEQGTFLLDKWLDGKKGLEEKEEPEMIFSDKLYPRPVTDMILDGTKCQTRRIVKEGEHCGYDMRKGMYADFDGQVKGNSISAVYSKNKKLKWRVGEDYSVQKGRGEAGVLYCPKCKTIYWKDDSRKVILDCTCWIGILNGKYTPSLREKICFNPNCSPIKLKPLRIKITDIRKEQLTSITLKDAKEEGFDSRWTFIKAFYSITPKGRNVLKGLQKEFEDNTLGSADRWNPWTWALSFKVKEGKA